MKPKTWCIWCVFALILIIILSGFVLLKINKKTLVNETMKFTLNEMKIYNIEITNTGFMLPELEIYEGDKVIWRNPSSIPHRIVSNSGEKFDSGNLLKNQNYTYVFNKEGTYDYKCMYNPYKKGEIIVKKK